MLSLAAQGNLQFEQVPTDEKPQKRAVVSKGVSWELVIPDGEAFGFNVQTWGETTRKLFKPIMALSDANFAKIVEATQCYIKTNAKGKARSIMSPTGSDDEDDFEDLYEFR